MVERPAAVRTVAGSIPAGSFLYCDYFFFLLLFSPAHCNYLTAHSKRRLFFSLHRKEKEHKIPFSPLSSPQAFSLPLSPSLFLPARPGARRAHAGRPPQWPRPAGERDRRSGRRRRRSDADRNPQALPPRPSLPRHLHCPSCPLFCSAPAAPPLLPVLSHPSDTLSAAPPRTPAAQWRKGRMPRLPGRRAPPARHCRSCEATTALEKLYSLSLSPAPPADTRLPPVPLPFSLVHKNKPCARAAGAQCERVRCCDAAGPAALRAGADIPRPVGKKHAPLQDGRDAPACARGAAALHLRQPPDGDRHCLPQSQ